MLPRLDSSKGWLNSIAAGVPGCASGPSIHAVHGATGRPFPERTVPIVVSTETVVVVIEPSIQAGGTRERQRAHERRRDETEVTKFFRECVALIGPETKDSVVADSVHDG
jgi:hypothetical protein